MNKRLFFTIIGVLMTLSSTYSKTYPFKTFKTESNGVKIEINSKLEMFHIMAYLSNSNNLNSFDFKYKSDIDSFFDSYKNDSSVLFVKKVLQNYHGHFTINELFFNTNFNKRKSFLNFLTLDNFDLQNTLLNKSRILDSLNNAVSSFAKISKFEKFVENHQEYYQQKIDDVASAVKEVDIIQDFEAFWGSKKNNYTIVISLLEHDIHASWFTKNDQSNCFFFLPPKFVVNTDAKFGNSNITDLRLGKMRAQDYIYYSATHEIGHSFLNPILEKFNEQIEQIPFIYNTDDPTKLNFLCESFLRSLTTYFLTKNQYIEFGQMVLQGEKQQGYIYNGFIVDLIEEYSNNRFDYKSFIDYVPIFLKRLKQKVENK